MGTWEPRNRRKEGTRGKEGEDGVEEGWGVRGRKGRHEYESQTLHKGSSKALYISS
jgi:hypothetical protein